MSRSFAEESIPPATLAKVTAPASSTKGLWADIAELFERHKPFAEFLKIAFSFLLGLVSAGVTSFFFLKTMVNSAIVEKLGPYETLLTGVSLNLTNSADSAAKVFRPLVRAKANSLPTQPRELIYDGFLYAVVNSARPAEFSPEMSMIMNRVGTKVAKNGWRLHQIGWYLLHTGQASEAKQYFDDAKQLYDSDQHHNQAADPERGLLFIALLKNDLQTALKLAKDIAKRDPKHSELPDLIREAKTWPQERWFSWYSSSYPELNETVKAYVAELSESPESHLHSAVASEPPAPLTPPRSPGSQQP